MPMLISFQPNVLIDDSKPLDMFVLFFFMLMHNLIRGDRKEVAGCILYIVMQLKLAGI